MLSPTQTPQKSPPPESGLTSGGLPEDTTRRRSVDAASNDVPPPPPGKREKEPVSTFQKYLDLITSIPRFALESFLYAFTPRQVAKQYTGWLGKLAVLAAFGLFVSVAAPYLMSFSVIAAIVESALPQITLLSEFVKYAFSPGGLSSFVFIAAATVDKEITGDAWRSGKDAGKDFVKSKLKPEKDEVKGYSLGDWKNWLLGRPYEKDITDKRHWSQKLENWFALKMVDVGGLVGGMFGVAYAAFLAQVAANGVPAFVQQYPKVGPFYAAFNAARAVFNLIPQMLLASIGMAVLVFV